MRIFVAVIVSAAVSVAASYLIVSKQKETAFHREREALKADWDKEKAELEADLRAAKNKPARIETIRVPSANSGVAKFAPQEALEKLKGIKVGSGSKRAQSIRQVAHYMECLVDAGPDALPVIREFLSRFEDVDYAWDEAREVRGGEGDQANRDRREPAERSLPMAPAGGVSSARLDFDFPPSLRLGLVDVLKEIGGESAQQILAEMLGTSGRGVEVAYVAKVLQQMAPNEYRKLAVDAAKDLLANPPTIDRPSRLDENAKSYLYTVLAMYNDSSFANAAPNVLVNAEGKIDRTALNYLTATFKDQAVPALYQAYKDTRITNLWDKASLAGQALNYAGTNPQANDMLKEVVNNEALPAWMRAMTIQSLAGTGFFGGGTPSDPQQIQSRIKLLTAMPALADEQIERARVETIEKLSGHLAGKAESNVEADRQATVGGTSPTEPAAPAEVRDP